MFFKALFRYSTFAEALGFTVACVLVSAALGFAPRARADVSVSHGTWDLWRGTTILQRNLPSEEACVNAAGALSARTYTCHTTTTVVVGSGGSTQPPPTSPVDCAVSGWTQGSPQPATCPASGVQSRTDTRTILTQPQNGGAVCPALTQTVNVQCTPPVTPPPTGACAKSTPNVPDGPDGNGGCFPGPASVGPRGTLTTYTGPCTITAPNTVIDHKTVSCDINVQAPGLVITDSSVKGCVLQPDAYVSANFKIDHSKIDGADSRGFARINCGVGYQNFELTNSEVVNTNRGSYCEKNCSIQNNWIHGTTLEPVASNLAHASGVRVEQGTELIHNTLACDYTGPFVNSEIGCSADITGYPDFAPITMNTIDGNLLMSNNAGISFCAYGGATAGKPSSSSPTNATYIVFRNNVWQRGANKKCGAYGPVTDFASSRTGNVWSNNKWDDGTTVPPN